MHRFFTIAILCCINLQVFSQQDFEGKIVYEVSGGFFSPNKLLKSSKHKPDTVTLYIKKRKLKYVYNYKYGNGQHGLTILITDLDKGLRYDLDANEKKYDISRVKMLQAAEKFYEGFLKNNDSSRLFLNYSATKYIFTSSAYDSANDRIKSIEIAWFADSLFIDEGFNFNAGVELPVVCYKGKLLLCFERRLDKVDVPGEGLMLNTNPVNIKRTEISDEEFQVPAGYKLAHDFRIFEDKGNLKISIDSVSVISIPGKTPQPPPPPSPLPKQKTTKKPATKPKSKKH